MEEVYEDDNFSYKEGTLEILKFIRNVIICIVLAGVFISFIAQCTIVSGNSMNSTLADGDKIIIEKVTYLFKDPARFDVVVCENHLDEYIVKRIIGLPGETVFIDEEGKIFIDGEKLEENYGIEAIKDGGLASTEITLSSDEYFVLGDNRNNSLDSRFSEVGNIKRTDIVGRIWLRYYPLDKISFY